MTWKVKFWIFLLLISLKLFFPNYLLTWKSIIVIINWLLFHSILIPRFCLKNTFLFLLFIDFLKEKKVGNYVLFYSSILYYGYESKSLKGAHSIQESRANRFPGNDSLFLALNFFPLSLSQQKFNYIRIIKKCGDKAEQYTSYYVTTS